MKMDLNPIATRISEKFAQAGHSVETAKVFEKLNRFVNEFGIPPQEAERSITSEYSRQFGMVEQAAPPQRKEESSSVIPISEVRPGDWVTLVGVVQVLFPPRSPAVAQSGILADESGTIRFTVWAKSNAPVLETGNWYRFESAVADEYNGQINFKVHSGTTITPLAPEEIPVGPVTPVGEIHPGIVSVQARVVSISDRVSEALVQSGVLADSSGAVRFSIRKESGINPLEENRWYRIDRASCDLYRGAMSMQIGAGTGISPLDDDVSIRPAFTNVIDLKPGVACLRVKMVQEWESNSDRMLQSGIVGDETGTVRFVIWKDNNMGRLNPGVVYNIYYTTIDQYNDRLSLTLNGSMYMPDETGTIQVKSQVEEVSGALVHISPGSGLIKRCPVEGCGRVLSRQNYCQIHEIQPDFSYDLRIKGWIDNGRKTWDTVIPREAVEHLLGLTLDDAREMAENNPLGLETVYYHLCEKVLGRYLTCQGRVIDNRLLVQSCSFTRFDPARHATLINRAGEAAGGVQDE